MLNSFNGPVSFAMLASFCFGLAMVLTKFGLRHLDATTGALVSIPTTAVVFWALAPFVLQWGPWDYSAILIFAVVGLFFPALGMLTQ